MYPGHDLRASVGSASGPLRVVISLTLAAVSAAAGWGLWRIVRAAPLLVDVAAIFILAPVILASFLAAIFALVPLSRFGSWVASRGRK